MARTDSRLPDIPAPPLSLLLLESRVLAEWPRFQLQSLSLGGLPRGDGHAVLVLPGFGASDITTRLLRRALARLGYTVYGWQQGRNFGMRSELKTALAQRLHDLHALHGPVSLIGWSLGGVFAREMARRNPECVRAVYTLGSPIGGRPDANNMNAMFRLINRGRPVKPDIEGFLRRCTPPPVRCVAIYSLRDGIVSWRCCLEQETDHTENVQVRGSHFGLVFNREVLKVLAQRLPYGGRLVSDTRASPARKKSRADNAHRKISD